MQMLTICENHFNLRNAFRFFYNISLAQGTKFSQHETVVHFFKLHILGEKPRYSGTFAAFREIAKKEGILALWKGVGPTVQRAAILTAAQIPTYDHTKYMLIHRDLMEEGLKIHLVSAMFAGFVTAFVTNPIDVIKTRIMNENVHSQQQRIYTSSFSSFMKILKTEGVLGLYKGFFPNWLRLGPHTVITFLIFEKLRKTLGLKPV